MSTKEERKREKRRKTVRDALIVFAAALFFIVLGIIGIVRTNNALKEYQESDDVRTVTAGVTYAAIRSVTEDGIKTNVWDADLVYEVDGKTYTAKLTFGSEVKAGDVRNIEVYRASEGVYLPAEIKTEEDSSFVKFLYHVSLVVGILLACAATVVILPERDQKKNKKK